MNIKLSAAAIAVTAMALASCNKETFYQVGDIKASVPLTQSTDTDQPFVYTSSGCSISYDFWAEGGSLSFVFHNSTDRNVYIPLDECFAVVNGMAYDYYTDAQVSYTRGTAAAKGVSAAIAAAVTAGPYISALHPDAYATGAAAKEASASMSASSSRTVTVRMPRVVCVPAGTSKTVACPVSIADGPWLDCDYDNFPRKQSTPKTFTEQTTPLTVENHIAYSFSPDGQDAVHLKHHFWLASVTNYSENGMTDTRRLENCLNTSSYTNEKEQRYFATSSPRSFYTTFQRSSTSLYRIKSGKGEGNTVKQYNSNWSRDEK